MTVERRNYQRDERESIDGTTIGEGMCPCVLANWIGELQP